jgi:hypothetical protein
MLDSLEEPGALGGVVPKLVTQDAEGAGSVGKASRDFLGRRPFNEEAAQGFILAVQGCFRGKEELGFRGRCYSISSI